MGSCTEAGQCVCGVSISRAKGTNSFGPCGSQRHLWLRRGGRCDRSPQVRDPRMRYGGGMTPDERWANLRATPVGLGKHAFRRRVGWSAAVPGAGTLARGDAALDFAPSRYRAAVAQSFHSSNGTRPATGPGAGASHLPYRPSCWRLELRHWLPPRKALVPCSWALEARVG